MINLRRLMGLPRFPMGVYVLILALFLIFAYAITGPAYRFVTLLRSSVGLFYEPRDLERGEHLKKLIEQNKR